METRYEMEPTPIGRSTRRSTWAVVATIGLFLGVVIVKPWEAPTVAPALAAVAPSTALPIAAPSVGVRPAVGPITEVTPHWPAAATASDGAAMVATAVEQGLSGLAIHAGTWGVGSAGVGPRLIRDETWTDWTAAVPEPSGDVSNVAYWPGSDICAGRPTINDWPSLVAVTAPSDLVPDWRLDGWWTNGAAVADLAGSFRQVSPAGNRGVSYLERTDRARWPPGLYEFHVIAGQRTVALTVCITRHD